MDAKRNGQYLLIVEDSSIDYEIVIRALSRVQFEQDIHHCSDGDRALELLLTDNSFMHERGYPSMILLDLNLPGTDGREVLEQIKGNAQTCHIPVIILSTSNNERDIAICYENGANCYVQKPTSPDDYVGMARALNDFWFHWASLPEAR